MQEIIKGNGNGSGKATRNKHGALLKGLLYCASCGAAMAHTYSKKGNRLYRYYVCTTAQKQGREACSKPTPQDRAEAAAKRTATEGRGDQATRFRNRLVKRTACRVDE